MSTGVTRPGQRPGHCYCSQPFFGRLLAAVFWSLGFSSLSGPPALADAPIAGKASLFEVSAPIRDLQPNNNESAARLAPSRLNPLSAAPDGGERGTWDRDKPPLDRLIRSSQNAEQQTAAPDRVFDGISNPTACDGCAPPHTVGAAGPNHFVQATNQTKVAIYRHTGRLAAPIFDLSDLWSRGPCTRGRGNPMVLFDSLSGRWVLAQTAGSRHLCFAVSRNENPTGSYFLYTFDTGELPRDFKVGAWRNGYYVSSNETTYAAYAFDRIKMLAGVDNVGFIKFTGAPNFLMPADVDGITGPDGGGLFYTFLDDDFHGGADRIELYELKPNFLIEDRSTFRLRSRIRIKRFTYTACGFFNLDCIRQKGTTQKLDAVSEWPMHRFAYRRVGSKESLVGNFTVGGGKGQVGAAIRWFELRNTADGWTLFQEGTQDPGDGLDRFLGSIAMDKDGNIALGYSASSKIEYPSIRYAMRMVGDPAGTLRQERVLKAGNGSQTGPNRWGSVSSMTVDPATGCQFWYTNELYSQRSRADWQTAIGAFTASTCSQSSGFPDASNTGVSPGTALTNSASITSSARGQIIEKVRVNGSIVINHDNVIVRQCEVINGAIFIRASNVTVEYCTITPRDGWNSAIGVSSSNAIVRRNNISKTENGVFVDGTGHLIEDNYIHDLEMPTIPDPHIDGVQLVGGETSNVIIRGNSIMLHNGANAAVTMGVVQNVTVANNRLHWGGYTVYVDGRHGAGVMENVQVINNRFGPHTFGYISIDRANPVVSGNVNDLTGEPIP